MARFATGHTQPVAVGRPSGQGYHLPCLQLAQLSEGQPRTFAKRCRFAHRGLADGQFERTDRRWRFGLRGFGSWRINDRNLLDTQVDALATQQQIGLNRIITWVGAGGSGSSGSADGGAAPKAAIEG